MTVRTIDGCIKCGTCLRVCPILRAEGSESFPGPKRLVVEGPRFNKEYSSLSDSLALCTTCGRCKEACPSQLPLPESLIKLKSSFDLFQTAGQVKMRENFDRHGRTVPPKKGTERPVHGDLAFFPGCISDGKLEEVVEASLRLLQAAGYQPFVPANWACCGSPFEKTGDGERLRKALNINVVSLQSVETVVTSCPGCTVQLQKDHGKNVLHIIEFLHASAALSSSSFDENAPAIKVALHQPCHLARAVGPHTMDMVRDMLSLVPGVTIVEYEGEDECCGGGGGVASSRPEVAMRMAVRKITAARRADADVLLAPCPFCVVNLRKAGSMAAEELTTFLARRLVNGNTHK